jgi:hypothetical protein
LKYDIRRSLHCETSELWGLRQHQRDVRAGDRVYVWVSGEEAGIYAIGSVRSDPVIMPEDDQGMQYWIDREQGGASILASWWTMSGCFWTRRFCAKSLDTRLYWADLP